MAEKSTLLARTLRPQKLPVMKSLLFSLLTVALTTLSTRAQVPVGPGSIKLGKVQPAVVKTPEFNLTSGPTKRSKSQDWLEIEVEFESAPEAIAELTFKYTVLLEKKLLDGEVTHVSIPKGKDHYSVMYVSPRSIERLTGGKPLTGAAIENVWVEVTNQGQKLGATSFRPGAIPNGVHLSGMLLNKNDTPFAPLFYDRYEAIKPR
jgi:hypothetical protein